MAPCALPERAYGQRSRGTACFTRVTGLDWIIVALAALLAALPASGRASSSARLSLAGFAAGAFLGTPPRARCCSSGGSPRPTRRSSACSARCSAARCSPAGCEGLALRLRRRWCGCPAFGVARRAARGACSAARSRSALVWIAGAVGAADAGRAGAARATIQRSAILRTLNDAAAAVGPDPQRARALRPAARDRGPAGRRARRRRAAIARDPEVARGRARASCGCSGTACGLGVEGSGWVAGPGLVVTNAHVVAGEDDTTVAGWAARGRGARRPGRRLRPARRRRGAARRRARRAGAALVAARPPRDGAGAILGFPRERALRRARRRRIGRDARPSLTQDAYGRGPVRAALTPLRGRVPPGNSGGPLVDGDGPRAGDGLRRDARRRPAAAATPCRRDRRARSRARRPAHGVDRALHRLTAAGAAGPAGRYADPPMAKTLVIAEKPSVGQDLARVLPGPFEKHTGRREDRALARGPRARHHLGGRPPRPARRARRVRRQVQEVADGRPADRAPTASSSSCATSARRSRCPSCASCCGRDDVDLVVNACDAGREGELIFAYLYEKAGAEEAGQAAVAVLDDERRRCARRFAHLRDAEDYAAARGGRALALGGRLDRRHERHARGDDPPALVLRRRRLARPRADADAGDPRPPRGGDPRVRARALLARRRDASRPTASADATRAASTPGAQPRLATAEEAEAIVEAVRGQAGHDHQAREDQAHASARRCSTT